MFSKRIRPNKCAPNALKRSTYFDFVEAVTRGKLVEFCSFNFSKVMCGAGAPGREVCDLT